MALYRISINAPIRICFIGCGKITRSHAKILRKIGDYEISFASRSEIKAETYKNELKGSRSYSSYESAINSTDEDVIMINTPPNSHYELAKKALNAGKHVIVEKPPFMNSSDFDELGSLADQSKLHLLVAENYYYKPLRKVVKKVLDEEWIGQPLFMVVNATKKQVSKGDWRDDEKISGFGALFEGGIHWINFINNLGMRLDRIEGFIPGNQSHLEKSMQVSAMTDQNMVINLMYSWEVNTIFKGLRISRIYGTEGSVAFESNGIFVWVRGRKKRLIFPGLAHITGSRKMWDDFTRAIREGQSPLFDWKMAKSDLKIIEDSYQSARS